jgi:MinD superfamily P-loop ATPase
MHLLEISESCTSCKTCIDACFVNAIGWNEKADKPILTYPEDCQICLYCERCCPEEALQIVPDWKSMYRIKTLSMSRR